MASTNKTSHYELSQYVGSDKPTYLTDYNNDMSAIDTGIYNAQTKADSAYTAAGLADGKAGDAQTTANAAVTSAGTANTNIGTMANLTTTEKSSLVGSINEVDANIKKFNFSTFTTYSTSDIVNNSNGTVTECSITLASNADNSIIKLYGDFVVDNATSNGTITIPTTRLRPTEEITINDIGIRFGYITNAGLGECYSASAKLKTNGDIELNFIASSSFWRSRVILFPCVIFVKNFGDIPTP